MTTETWRIEQKGLLWFAIRTHLSLGEKRCGPFLSEGAAMSFVRRQLR